MQELNQQERADALAAVGEGAVLDDEVQPVRGLRFDGRIRRLAKHALVEVAEQGGQPFLSLVSEQDGRFAARAGRA
jgi:hypothetical protein